MQSRLIGKQATITTKDSIYYGEWGTIKMFDGEYYHIAIYNDADMAVIFTRDEFRVRRG